MVNPRELPLDLEQAINVFEEQGIEIVGQSRRIHDPVEVAKIFKPNKNYGSPEFREELIKIIAETGAIHQLTFRE